MLVGYVSDERYVALPEVLLEFEREGVSIETRSRASGAVYADLEPGPYQVTLHKEGYGPKRVKMAVSPERPHQFRLLSHALLGYAWPRCVRSGERSEFRVHSTEAYKLELWRYGQRKELVGPLGWFDEHGPKATMQITPDGDYTQTGVQWNKFGYANPQHKQYAEAPVRSGLYYFHARAESGRFFSFPWVVAPARPTARIAVLASDMNWNAYNNFGGRSNYISPDGLPPRPTVNARLELDRYTDPDFLNYKVEDYAPLSFERPEPLNHIPCEVQLDDPIEGRAACHVAPTEWRLLGWLERQGFAYDLYSETQLHFGALDLDAYQVLILGPHPEYWSAEMYFAVKQWVHQRGGKLIYLGGNGLNCAVEFLDPQTMKVRNGDARQWRAKKVESRFHFYHESEANLLGVVYTDAGVMTAAPYQVVDEKHWITASAGLKAGQIFGRQSQHMRIPGGASGHETDKVSPSSPAGVQVVARGLNPDQGGAEMAYYTTQSGGAVFSTGSICYISSLLVDEAVSHLTANVVARFAE